MIKSSNDLTTKPIIIKKYPNRRLYNTTTSQYINLDQLFVMVQQNIAFIVEDAKNKKDITRSILIQIIFEQEAKGYNILPENFLRYILKMYSNDLQMTFNMYLEHFVTEFGKNVDNIHNIQQHINQINYIELFTNNTLNYYNNLCKLFEQPTKKDKP